MVVVSSDIVCVVVGLGLPSSSMSNFQSPQIRDSQRQKSYSDDVKKSPKSPTMPCRPKSRWAESEVRSGDKQRHRPEIDDPYAT